MDLLEVERDGMDWLGLTQDRWQAFVNAVLKLRFP
jgi:hypothetical protein